MELLIISLILGILAVVMPFIGYLFGKSAIRIAIFEFVETPIGYFFVIWPFYITGFISVYVAAALLLAISFLVSYFRTGFTVKTVILTVSLWVILSCIMFYEMLPSIFNDYLIPFFTLIAILSVVLASIYVFIPGVCILLEILHSKINHTPRTISYHDIRDKMRISRIQSYISRKRKS